MERDSRGELLVACLPVLHGYLRRLSGDRHTANELLQEVSVRILAGGGPSDPARFLAWCCGIARHALASDWRMRKRARAQLPLEGDLVDQMCGPSYDPDSHLDARSWLSRVMGRVGHEGLELLVRRYVLGESGRELADERAQSAAALRMRLMRLRSTLYDNVPAP
jgi:DNA-directed RNA polymerase specialized sigma24 family protein